MITTWPPPVEYEKHSEELLVCFQSGRAKRVLVLPAWFDEANKMRRFTLDTMRALDDAGIDSFLPDLPGCNESLAPLDAQTIAIWRNAANAAATAFNATHVLTIRSGVLLAPPGLPGWAYAPQSGAKTLRPMLRARLLSAREAGREEKADALLEQGKQSGLTLSGWSLSAAMLCELEAAQVSNDSQLAEVKQSELGGGGLWLRAEPGENLEQANALAAIVAGPAEEAE